MTPASRVLLIRIRGKGVPTPSRQSSEPYWRFPKESANVECKRGIKRLLLLETAVLAVDIFGARPWQSRHPFVKQGNGSMRQGGYYDQ